MSDPVVSIIIITCNRPFLLRHCIDRVLQQSYPYKEIIVVDSSTDDASERLVACYPQVLAVRLCGQRNNMPAARNRGIALASGEIIAFIDDDSMVQPGWLEALVDVYRDESVGAAGGRIITMPYPYCDQLTGLPSLTVSSSGRVFAQGTGLLSAMQCDVDHLIGCNMSFRRSVLEQMGGFDVNYTLTNLREETDLCVRVKKAGWRIIFHPAIAVIHFSARSLQPYFLERPSIQFSNGRNCTYFAIKHFGLNAHTVTGQLIDTARCCGRAAYFASLFSIGAAAQITGRIVGVVEGIRWLMNSQQRL